MEHSADGVSMSAKSPMHLSKSDSDREVGLYCLASRTVTSVRATGTLTCHPKPPKISPFPQNRQLWKICQEASPKSKVMTADLE